jgi:hypothetical protein
VNIFSSNYKWQIARTKPKKELLKKRALKEAVGKFRQIESQQSVIL